MFNGVKFEITENEKNTILKSLHKDKYGFNYTLKFTKDKEKSERDKNVIYDFFSREMFKE